MSNVSPDHPGYRALVAMIVMQAISDHAAMVLKHGEARALHEEPARWLCSTATDPGSCRWCCDALELDFEAVRTSIARQSLDLVKGLGKPGLVFSSGRRKARFQPSGSRRFRARARALHGAAS